MTKRILAVLLALIMVVSLAACGKSDTPEEPESTTQAADNETVEDTPAETAEAQSEAEESTEAEPAETSPEEAEPAEPADAPLPEDLKPGDAVAGFTVAETRDFPLVGAKLILFEHGATGAKLLFVANNDTNRVFDLTFLTRAIDNTGLPHVFEHATLSGSEKYPSKSLFFNLSYQTYNTYMNAATYPLMTTYPVASLSEAQLLKYADFYTDSCLHPMILKDESIFRTEAWRYRMDSAEDPLTIEGTVYSEMQGAMDLASMESYNMLRSAFPGSLIGNISGGDPAFIPDMTFEALKNYHELYYHPSNCVAYLYGHIEDYAAFLQLLDEAFAPYEKREFTFEDEDYTPITDSIEIEESFPVENGSDTQNASETILAYICPGLADQPEEENVLNTMTDLLGADASPLMQELKKQLPNGQFSVYIDTDGPEDLIVFDAENMNTEDAETFKEIVSGALADLAQNGFDSSLVDSVSANMMLSTRLISEESGFGVDLIESMAYYYASNGDLYGYLSYIDAIEHLNEWNEAGRYKEAAAKWLGEDAITVLSTTYPKPGLREELDEAEAQRLDKVQAEMSQEELDAIIAASSEQDTEDDASQYVAQLQAETTASLPEEIREFEVDDQTGEDGVRYLSAKADVDGVGRTALFFDATGLPQEDIHWFALYTTLVGELDTAKTSKEELAVEETRWLYDGEIRLSIMEDPDTGRVMPRLRAGWTAADEDLARGYELMHEILFETEFTDIETISGLISRTKGALKSGIMEAPESFMLQRALGNASPLSRYYSYFKGIEYYEFLEKAETLVTEQPEVVTESLMRVQKYFANRTNALAMYAGSEDGIAANAEAAAAFMAKLEANPIEPVDYELPAPAKNEALIIDTTVAYNGMVIDYETLGIDGYSGEMDAVTAAIEDLYLLPTLRDQYGAYGVWTGFYTDDGLYIVSYRDPNIAKSFEVYEGLPEYLRSLTMTQEELDGYILSTYSNYAMPEGELTGGIDAAIDVLLKESPEQTLEYMRQLKALTPDKIAAYADIYQTLIDKGARFTVGGASAVNEESERFDEILNPFGAVDASEAELTDVPEGHEHYDAVRFVFENLLMVAREDGSFGVDDPATIGDLAGALYSMIGGDPAAQEEAVEFFQDYEIIPATASADTELNGKDVDLILADFSMAVEVEYEHIPGAKPKPVTRGELAEMLTTYAEPLLIEE